MASYEIRTCDSCGLRYPLVEGHPFGRRCPSCMGNTQLVLSRKLAAEPIAGRSRFAGSLLHEEEKPDHDHQAAGVHISDNFAVLLDNIRSAWNVGSILRSADGFGFTHAFLCGITPTADNEAVTKTSLGAEDSVPWSYHKDAVKLVRGLKAEGWRVYALEEDPRAIMISGASSARFGAMASHRNAEREVLILGNEVTGVNPELLDLCDEIFFIRMRGEKRSFNVAIAFGIAAYALTVQKLEH